MTDREQILKEARALHKSIVKKMTAAGYTYKKIKRDVEKGRVEIRKSSKD